MDLAKYFNVIVQHVHPVVGENNKLDTTNRLFGHTEG